MRLINVRTLEFEEFEGQDIPSYAILSHRWQREEVLFKDMIEGTADRKKGIAKIKNCCHQAEIDGHDYVWIDTCCIDKSSSAELSEAINTMFRWYQNAKLCYVYLSDVDAIPADPDFESIFEQSEWFTRGWTLQELIAPDYLDFFNSKRVRVGCKSSLRTTVADITSVPGEILTHEWALQDLPVARRMSWAADRQTTRIEDRAYSLMGIFGINMPMLYGEGENAFRRVQEEIVRRYNDLSILLFQNERSDLLANSPRDFAVVRKPLRSLDKQRRSEEWIPSCSSDEQWRRTDWTPLSFDVVTSSSIARPFVKFGFSEDEPSVVTNIGLSASLPLLPWYFDTYLALVDIMWPLADKAAGSRFLLCFIYLRPSRPGSLRMFRVSWDGEFMRCISLEEYKHLYGRPPFDVGYPAECTKQIIILPKAPFEVNLPTDPFGFILPRNSFGYVKNLVRRSNVCLEFKYSLTWGPEGFPKPTDVISRNVWNEHERQTLRPKMPYEILAIIRAYSPSGQRSYVYIVYDDSFDLLIVYRAWDPLFDVYFDSSVENTDYNLRIHLDPTRLWSCIHSHDGSVEYQIVKISREKRRGDGKQRAKIPDLGIAIDSWYGNSEFYVCFISPDGYDPVIQPLD